MAERQAAGKEGALNRRLVRASGFIENGRDAAEAIDCDPGFQ
jgi:hypothetical protein